MVGQIRAPAPLIILELERAWGAEHWIFHPKLRQLAHEGLELPGKNRILPVLPSYLVILAVGIVIPHLGIAAFIPHPQQGNALGQENRCKGIFDLLPARLVHLPLTADSFLPAVTAEIPVIAIPVPF